MAGVFTVAGLVVVVFVIALATNAVRRRRARKFDEDVAAAAADAAKAPRYPFDEFDEQTAGYAAGPYSDQESHGTYAQPPLSYDSYAMNDLPGPGYGAAGAGAGVGVARQRSRKDSGGTDVTAGIAGFASNTAAVMRNTPAAPYGAYSGPPLPEVRGFRPDVIDPNMAAGGAAYHARRPSDPHTHGNPNPAVGRRPSGRAPQQESYAAHYQRDFAADQHTYTGDAAYNTGIAPPVPHPAMANPYSPTAPVGFQQQQQQHYQQPRAQSPSARSHEYVDEDAYASESYYASPPTHQIPFGTEDSRMSFRDDEDYAVDTNRRVLKVRTSRYVLE